MHLCEKCVNLTKETICKECQEWQKMKNYEEAIQFQKEGHILYEQLLEFLRNKKDKKIVYAYSGGLDSTVVLYQLKELCRQEKIELRLFTIDNGFKGKKTWNNIQNCLKAMELKENWKLYSVKNEVIHQKIISETIGESLTVAEIYSYCFMNNILPCGKICNSIMEQFYQQILEENEEEYLVTGGDTPKINEKQEFSIFWKKPSNVKIVRAGAAFRLQKEQGKRFLQEHSIPWEDPCYGGYDTDCLVPGSILASLTGAENRTFSIEEIKEKFPVVIDFFSERVRMGVIERKSAIAQMGNLDISSYEGYVEMKNTVSSILNA